MKRRSSRHEKNAPVNDTSPTHTSNVINAPPVPYSPPPDIPAPLKTEADSNTELHADILMGWAIENGYPDVFKAVSSNEGNIDEINEALMESPALVWAAYRENYEIVEALLSFGAHVDVIDKVSADLLSSVENLRAC